MSPPRPVVEGAPPEEPADAPAGVFGEAPATGYALLDAGGGRRLEQFGPHVVDRPAPSSAGIARADPEAWILATARFERGDAGSPGGWFPPGALPESWPVAVEGAVLELRPTPAGQVGIFPEHLSVARWAGAQARAAAETLGRPPDVLNLFAYTGLATIIVSAAGARVVHVDASRPAVAWARRNAEMSGAGARPIRWLVEDAARFVAREGRRGHRYDGVLLDPPTWGHGPGGQAWRLEDDLPELLAGIRAILSSEASFLACTAHATDLSAASLGQIVGGALGRSGMVLRSRDLALAARSGARLETGCAVLATGDGLRVRSRPPAEGAGA